MNFSPPKQALARAVTMLRLERKLSQEELARRAGLHLTLVRDIESAQHGSSWRTLTRFSRGLEIPVSELAARAEGG